MSYDVHYLCCNEGQHWLDALEEQEQRARRAAPRTSQAVRREWWRVATCVYREVGGGELRHRSRTLHYVHRSHGIQLELAVEGVSMWLDYVHDESTARAALSTARAIADVVERETQLVAFDPQLGGRFLQHGGCIARAANMMAATRRYLVASGDGAAPPLPRCAVSLRPAPSDTRVTEAPLAGPRPLRD